MNIAFCSGLIFTLFGLYMLRHAITQHRKAVASLKWPAIKGEMLEVHLWGKRNIGGEIKEVNNLVVEYSYEAGGSLHKGSNATYYTLMYPDTVEFAEAHPAGAKVDIHYDPHKPGDSVVIPGPRESKPYSDLLLGGVGILIGLMVMISAYMGWIG